MKHTSGFTLLELLIIVAIMGILLSFALPALQPMRENAAEKEAARNVLAALRIARSNAITQNVEYQVAFDLDTRSFWLEEGDLPSDSTVWIRVRDFGQFTSGLQMATKKECDHLTGDGTQGTADNIIQFNPNGTCGSSGVANARYICVMGNDGLRKFRTGIPSSITGRAIITK